MAATGAVGNLGIGSERATAEGSVLRHDVHDLQPDPSTYVRGRVVLLGDAAHAMTPNLGQGAGQALEDSATLGALLHPDPDADPIPALSRYDALHRPRAQLVNRRSRRIGTLGQQPLAVVDRGDRLLAATILSQS